MHASNKTKAQLLEEIEALQETVRSHAERLEAAALQSGIIESAMDAIIVIDEAQNIVQFNAAAEKIFGYTAEQRLGKPLHNLLPDRMRARHHQHVQRFGDTGITSRSMHQLGVLSGQRSNGEVFPLEISISQTTVNGKKYHAAILRDISERERLERLILQQYDSLNTLHLITLGLLNRREITDLLQFIVDETVKLLEVSYCEILLPNGNELVAQAFTRNQPFATGNRFMRDAALLSWQVFDTGKPAVLDDYSTWAHRHAIYNSEEFHAAAALPLMVDGLCIGVLGITRDKPGYKFTEGQILTAARLADIAALAIENSRLYMEVKRLATTDELTGVHNRRSLMQVGEREAQRAARYGRPLSVLMLDVDHFKRVNDAYGHPAGDAVLRGVAQETMRQIRHLDMIGRYEESQEADRENIIGRFGGEEFGILLPETSLDGALMVAERIRFALERMVFTAPDAPNETIRITVSIGVSCLLSKSDGLPDMIARADQALYIAKQSGRNRVCSLVHEAHEEIHV